MSMEFGNDNEFKGGGGGALMGLLAGSCLNKDRDEGRGMTWFAMVIVLIVFFIAIIFLALAFKDNRKDGHSTDVAALLTPLIAAKSMDCNNNGAIDKFEIMQKIEHSEDRARETQTQQELGALGKEFANIGFGLSSKIDNVEKESIKQFATVQNQLGVQSQALQQILTTQNNQAIVKETINGVIMQLTMGIPRAC